MTSRFANDHETTQRYGVHRAASMGPPIALLVAMGVMVWVGLWHIQTPTPRPDTAPATVFSAERAMAHLRALAKTSRAVGTPGHEAARNYLVEHIRSMGLQPTVQETSVHVRFAGANGFSAGTVQNVLARIPGRNSTGAIAINAHYDSGTTGPGASDCGSCVVTALETMRALLAGPPLRNDVVFVFTDAEEEGDLGAAAFAQEHPWARDIRLAINYEAQGSGGAAILYASSERDGWLIKEFLDAAPGVRAYSWMGAIMELYPQGQLACDLAEYMKVGVQGLGFVYLANTTDYHTVRDNIERIDPGSIQQEGDYTMAFLRHFGHADLAAPPRGDNRVFFNVLPRLVAHYPYQWVLPIAGLITLLVLTMLVAGYRSGALQLKKVLTASAALGLGTLAAVVLSVLLWIAIKSLNPTYQVALVGSYQSDLYTVAFIALTVALMAVLYALTRRVGRLNLFAGALFIWLPLLWLISYAMPAMSYIASWPLLFGTLPLGWALMTRQRSAPGWPQVAVLTVAAAPSILLLPATLYQAVGLINRFEGAAGIPLFGIMTLFVAPTLLLLMPQLDLLAGRAAVHRWTVPAVAALIATVLIATVLIGWANITSGFDAERPRPDHMTYVLNSDTNEAQWVSFDRHLDHWTSQFIAHETEPTDYETVTWGTFQAFSAPAPSLPLPAPVVDVASDSMVESNTASSKHRAVTLEISSARQAPHMRVRVQADGPILAARLNGRPLDLSAYTWARDGLLQINYANVPVRGISLSLEVASTRPLVLRAADSTVDLPEHPALDIPRRPTDTMPVPLFPRDATTVVKAYTL